jgi:UDP-glucose 4-epimerase
VITGGAGFIGAALANTLSADETNDVLCIDNLITGNWGRIENQDRVQRVELDLTSTSEEELSVLFQGATTVFHLAAVKLHNEKNSFQDVVSNNVLAAQKVFEAAGQAKVENVVFTSSLYTYGLQPEESFHESSLLIPNTIYGASKVFGEHLLSIAAGKFGFKYAIARLFFIYGEKQYSLGGYKSVIVNNFERLHKGTPAIVNGDGMQVLDYVYITDCVDALILLSQSPQNQTLNVASNSALTILEITNLMCEISGNNSIEFADKDWTFGTRRVGSNEKIRSLKNCEPKTSMKEGLQKTWKSIN